MMPLRGGKISGYCSINQSISQSINRDFNSTWQKPHWDRVYDTLSSISLRPWQYPWRTVTESFTDPPAAVQPADR